MIKEIKEGPKAFRDTITANSDKFKSALDIIKNKARIIVTACGTSYHAGLVLAYSISRITGIPSYAVQASEFIDYGKYLISGNSLVVALSQSGETSDTIEAVRSVVNNTDVIALTNREGSSLEKLAKLTIITKAGEEKAVAATKTFIAQLAAIYGIVAKLENRNDLYLMKIADDLSVLVNNAEKIIKDIAGTYKSYENAFILGLGHSFITSLEAALKLKETCGIHAEAYSIYEFRHGPIALESPRVFNLFVEPMENLRWKKAFEKVMERIKDGGAGAIIIKPVGDEKILENFNYIEISKVAEPYSTALQIIPIQLLAYYIAVEKGLNPDSPKFLTKVVSG